MSMQERFREGIYASSHSFAMLYAHKKLLIYLGIAAVLYFFVQVLVCNMPMIGFAGDELTLFIGMQGIQYSLIEFTQWLHQGILVIITFIYSFIITFLNICLIRHALALIYEDAERARVRVVLSKSWSAINRIFMWAVLFTVMRLILRVIALSTYASNLSYIIGLVLASILATCWSLLTFFVLPIIAVHDVSIWRAIKTSYKMVLSLFVEIIGAECWFGVISLLIFIPLSIILHAFGQGSSIGFLIGSMLSTLMTVFAGYIILSAQVVLKTILYYRYVQPMQEMAFLSYPHF
jgi:hypothetical protein